MYFALVLCLVLNILGLASLDIVREIHTVLRDRR
jgi:hypothetical protein